MTTLMMIDRKLKERSGCTVPNRWGFAQSLILKQKLKPETISLYAVNSKTFTYRGCLTKVFLYVKITEKIMNRSFGSSGI